MPTSPRWKGSFEMVSVATTGEASGDGEGSGDGDCAAADGLASRDGLGASEVVTRAHAPRTKMAPATSASCPALLFIGLGRRVYPSSDVDVDLGLDAGRRAR